MIRMSCRALALALTFFATAAPAERVVDQITIARPADTASLGAYSWMVPEASDTVLFESLAPDLLAFGGRTGHLTNLFRSSPTGSILPIRTAHGAEASVTLLGSDPAGRWLVLASTCRLDRADQAACNNDVGSGFGQYLLDTLAGHATLITHVPGQPQDIIADFRFPQRTGDVRVSTDGRFVHFTSGVNGLVPGLVATSGELLAYRFDRQTGENRRVGRFDDVHADSYRSRILWASADGSQALVALILGLIRSDANTGTDTPVLAELDDWSFATASRNGAFVIRCDRFEEGSWPDPVRRHFQFTRITVATGERVVVNPAPSGFVRASAQCTARISDDGDLVIGPEWHPRQPVGTDQVVRWRVTDRSRTLLTPKAGDATAPSNDAGYLLDTNADASWVLIQSHGTDLLAGVPGHPEGALYLYRQDRSGLTLVSRDPGNPDRALPGWGRLTGSGDWIPFASTEAPSIFRDDNGDQDLFAFRTADAGISLLTRRVSEQRRAPNGPSSNPQVSDDGTWIAYGSSAGNLIAEATIPAETRQVLLTRSDGSGTRLVSHEPGMPQRGSDGESFLIGMSSDGRHVIFHTTAAALFPPASKGIDPRKETFSWDRDTGVQTLVTRFVSNPGTGANSGYSIASDRDGTWVLHGSDSPERLVPGYVAPTSNPFGTVLLRLPIAPDTMPELVTHAHGRPNSGPNAPVEYLGHSADLRQVAFSSRASDLLETPVTTSLQQVYIADRQRNRTHWLTRSATNPGAPADAEAPHRSPVRISADGKHAVFTHAARDLVSPAETGPLTLDCYRVSLDTGIVLRVSERTSTSPQARCDAVSDDGRFVLYTTFGDDVQGLQGQVWRADLQQGTRTLASQSPSGEPGNAPSAGIRLSARGDQALFGSTAGNLIASSSADTTADLFLRHFDAGTTELVSNGDAPGNDEALVELGSLAATPDFRTIVFASPSGRLKSDIVDPEHRDDLYVSRATRLGDNPGVSGLWGEAGVEGQGFHLVSIPGERRMLLSWYTYLAEGSIATRTKQRWLLGLGDFRDGVARFAVSAADSGVFDAAAAGVQVPLGEVILRFQDCNRAEASYSLTLDGRQHRGLIPLSRITPDTVCTSFTASDSAALAQLPRPAGSRWQYGLGGAWHDGSRPGQGLIVEVMPSVSQLIATWFTFDAGQILGDGRSPPLWLAAIGTIEGDRARLTVHESAGGTLDRASGTQLRAVGSLDLDVIDCNRLRATYTLTLGNTTRSGQIPLERITPDAGCLP